MASSLGEDVSAIVAYVRPVTAIAIDGHKPEKAPTWNPATIQLQQVTPHPATTGHISVITGYIPREGPHQWLRSS
jgi:hypothetical protein